MIPFWVTATIASLGLAVGSITDFDKREVPDMLNFLLIALGLSIGAVNSMASQTWWPLLNALSGFGVAYLVAALLFYSGQWGGGDAKMLMGLGALHGIMFFGPESIILNWQWPLLGTIIVAIFVAGSVYSILYFFGIVGFRFKRVLKELNNVRYTKKWKIARLVSAVFLIGGLAGYLILQGPLGWMLLLVGLLIGGGVMLLLTARVVQEKVMAKKVAVKDLVPGDWLVESVKQKGKIIVEQSKIGLVEKDIAQLKEKKVSSVVVKEGIPFIPGFLLGYITILIFGNWVPLAAGYIWYVF